MTIEVDTDENYWKIIQWKASIQNACAASVMKFSFECFHGIHSTARNDWEIQQVWKE